MESETHYSVIRSELADAELGPYTCYGICATSGGQIPDISTDYAEVAQLAARMNREGVEPCHMYDVIYDFVASR